MAIVLPDGIFGNPRQRYIIEFIMQEAKILAVVSLPPETFLPSTHTKTSVIFLEKTEEPVDEDYDIFMAIANKVGHDKNGETIYKMDEKGNYILDEHGNKIIDDDLPEIAMRYRLFREGKLERQDHLGFTVKKSRLRDYILLPSYYDPELHEALEKLRKSGRYRLISIGELVKQGIISIKRGHEVGSRFYGLGDVPFVRTSDIVNWEIKVDPVKCIPEEIYRKYKEKQDIRPWDILLVTDGTFLIGRTAIVTPLDTKMVIQSHIRRIRCLRPEVLHPFLLLYLLNTDIVQWQIKAKTLVQATISTVAPRLHEILLPIPKDKEEVEQIIKDVNDILKMKMEARRKMMNIIQKASSLLDEIRAN